MAGREIQPQIQKLQKSINENHKKWTEERSQKRKILKESGWNQSQIKDLIIFNEKVFLDKTEEGKIIWGEIHEQMANQLLGVIKNPIVWMIKNRFWINSEHIINTIGLKSKTTNGPKGKFKSKIDHHNN
jgi:methionine synthase II (cobalamin-independent)